MERAVVERFEEDGGVVTTFGRERQHVRLLDVDLVRSTAPAADQLGEVSVHLHGGDVHTHRRQLEGEVAPARAELDRSPTGLRVESLDDEPPGEELFAHLAGRPAAVGVGHGQGHVQVHLRGFVGQFVGAPAGDALVEGPLGLGVCRGEGIVGHVRRRQLEAGDEGPAPVVGFGEELCGPHQVILEGVLTDDLDAPENLAAATAGRAGRCRTVNNRPPTIRTVPA